MFVWIAENGILKIVHTIWRMVKIVLLTIKRNLAMGLRKNLNVRNLIMGNEALKPCPFCGGEGSLVKHDDIGILVYWVSCYESTCKENPQTSAYSTPEEAIAEWNNQADNKRTATCKKKKQIETKYLRFEELTVKTKTKQFAVKNKLFGGMIGHIKWHAPWRKYCFFVNGDFVFDAGCLSDITDFLDKLMSERKKEKEKR
jgi:hypothetical protein